MRSGLIVAACLAALAAASPALGDGGGVSDDPSAPAAAPDQFATVDHRSERASSDDFDRVAAKAAKGAVRVIVGLRTEFTPEGALSADQRTSQRGEIARATAEVRADLQGTRFSVSHTYDTVPYVALSLSEGALRKLQDSGRAASLQEDTPDPPLLAQSAPLVEAVEAATLSRGGTGQVVAILDTGVDKAHAFLQKSAGGTKVVSEACYSSNGSCPGGVAASTAAGSGVPCTYAAENCRHGTHVAGIAAGRGATFGGVAREANLVAVNVFSKFTGASCNGAGEDPCTLSYASDQIKGLERVLALKDSFSIASANMSLGGGHNTAACNSDSRKAAIDNLLAANIATAIASGNEGFSDGVSAPGCISTAVTVGSTTKSDAMSSFSNSSTLVDLLAPGSSINSSVPGGGFAVFSGTSMATPHVAGAFAILKQTDPAASVATKLAALKAEGKPITDPANDVTRSRIKVLAASAKLKDTGLKSSSSFSGAGVGVTSAGAGLSIAAARGGSGAPFTATVDVEGIPAGATITNAYLYWMTLGGPDTTAVLDGTSRTGVLVGAGGPSCWAFGDNGINRTYRASVTPAITGNGTHTIAGIGNGTTVDPQGASIVVVYNVASSSRTGRVYIRHGAVTGATLGKALSTTFSTSIPSAVKGRPALLVGMGDGEDGKDETAMQFGGTAVSAPSLFSSADGRSWDDVRIPLPVSLLPVNTVSQVASVALPAVQPADCLAWGWAALTYQY